MFCFPEDFVPRDQLLFLSFHWVFNCSIVAFVDFIYIPSSSNSSSLTKYQCQPPPSHSYHVAWQWLAPEPPVLSLLVSSAARATPWLSSSEAIRLVAPGSTLRRPTPTPNWLGPRSTPASTSPFAPTSPESPWASWTTRSLPKTTRTEIRDGTRVTARLWCISKTSHASLGLVSWLGLKQRWYTWD